MKTLEQKIEIMQAALDGKEIEALNKGCKGVWNDVSEIEWNWISYDYRIKEEPMEFWVTEYNVDGVFLTFKSEKEAERYKDALIHKNLLKVTKVREVTE